ncbi:MAG: TetR/AcrR family transcriptional regulator [Acidimicrobiia bacterium]|nr:TetR/AcrR family transcriptional regulator [Acidimicrobiia bacterium]
MARAQAAPRTKSRRGRPPNSDGQETAARLLDAAAAACAESGFDGATLNEIARRAGVTAAAIYNHYESREDLLYAAGVRALERVTDVVPQGAGADAARLIAAAYLRPELKQTRRLLAELHVASARDRSLAQLLGSWHRSWAQALKAVLPADDPAPEATVKTLFLLLLGLCHYDNLAAVKSTQAAVVDRVEDLVDILIPPRRAASPPAPPKTSPIP